jgi:hypothetical protein
MDFSLSTPEREPGVGGRKLTLDSQSRRGEHPRGARSANIHTPKAFHLRTPSAAVLV